MLDSTEDLMNQKDKKLPEIRTLLLYVVPVFLKGLLIPEKYIIFLPLSVFVRNLLYEDSNIRSVYPGYVVKIFDYFITNWMEYYGGIFTNYDTHSILDWCDDSNHFQKPLDDISCFPFENYNHIFKKYVSNVHNLVNQIAKGISQLEDCSNSYNKKFIHRVVATKTDKGTWFLLMLLNVKRMVLFVSSCHESLQWAITADIDQ